MSSIALIISAVLLAVSLFLSRKKPLSPEILFFGLWTFILALSALNLYDIYKPSDEAYILICVMLVSFCLGIVLYHIFIRSVRHINIQKIDTNYQLSNEPKFNIIYLLFLISILLLSIDCVTVINGVREGIPLWQVHGWHMEAFATADNPMMARRSFIEQVFRSVVVEPFQLIVPPLAAYVFFSPSFKRNKDKTKILTLSVIDIVFSTIANGGGRLGAVYYLLCFVLAFLLFRQKKHSAYFGHVDDSANTVVSERKKSMSLGKGQGFGLAVAVAALFAIIIAATQSRVGSGSLLKQIYTYFALPPTLLSEYLPILKITPHTFGMLSMYGFVGYAFIFLNAIGLSSLVPDSYSQAYQQLLNVENFKDVGYGVANAFVTPVYSFYVDGGVFFIIFASLICGVVVSYFFFKLLKFHTIKNFVYYAFVMNGIFLSMIRIQTSIPTYILAFFLTWVLLRPQNVLSSSSSKVNALVKGNN